MPHRPKTGPLSFPLTRLRAPPALHSSVEKGIVMREESGRNTSYSQLIKPCTMHMNITPESGSSYDLPSTPTVRTALFRPV